MAPTSTPSPAPRSKRIGRPPSPEPRDEQIQIRVSARERALWDAVVERLRAQSPVGRATQQDALRWLLEDDARREEEGRGRAGKASKRGG